MAAAYRISKDHAKARGIEFVLTLDEFREFCDKHGYIEKKGNHTDCLTIDRIDNLKPYDKDNIQPLSRLENIRKRFKYDQIRYEKGYSWKKR